MALIDCLYSPRGIPCSWIAGGFQACATGQEPGANRVGLSNSKDVIYDREVLDLHQSFKGSLVNAGLSFARACVELYTAVRDLFSPETYKNTGR